MERLTERDFQGNKLVLKNSVECTTENIKKWSVNKSAIGSITIRGEAVDKLAAYEDAEEQGLLLKLPIPIGTTVYKFEPLASGKKEYIKTRVSRYDVFGDSVWFCFLNGLGRNIEDFGKYVFLTQDEAEQKLKEMKS